jgi:hypothetical protein
MEPTTSSSLLSHQMIENSFWSQVWRCTHRSPCKRCCWPWKRRLEGYGTFRIPPHGPQIPAHRFALILSDGALLFPKGSSQGFTVCHQCDFSPCCNPLHLAVGTTGDNVREARDKGWFILRRCKPVRLPDGTLLNRTPKEIPVQLQPGWKEYLHTMRQRSLLFASNAQSLV